VNSKILVIGSNGLLGSNICAQLTQRKFDFFGLNRKIKSTSTYPQVEADISDHAQIKKIFAFYKFTHVINTAALSNQKSCQEDPALCRLINFEAVKNLAMASEEKGAKFVQISTDAVFDGKIGNYNEMSETNPFSNYGESKVLAEEIIINSIPNYQIIRGSFFGSSEYGSYSIFQFFLDSFLSGKRVNGYIDIVSSSTSVTNFAKQVLDLTMLPNSEIFHIGTIDKTSKFEFGKSILHYLNLNSDLITPTRIADENIDWNPSRDLSLNSIKSLQFIESDRLRQKDEILLELKKIGLKK
jgi:dTDP-4-dehydrorhamnose reductase